MKIGVCIKSTPDTSSRIQINPGGDDLSEAGVKWATSPYDMFAIEEAVQTKEATGGEVILFSASHKDTSKEVRKALALGPDSAVCIKDDGLAKADSLSYATSLAKAIEAEGCTLVFTGKRASDGNNIQVPAMVAELLGWPHVSFVTEFEVDGESFKAVRAVGGGVEEVITGNLPVVITAERGLNSPRYAKLPMIVKAKKKPLALKSLSDLGLSEDDVAPIVTLRNYEPPAERGDCIILEGDAATTAKELVRRLREEAKVL